jgi:hypothetical protein
MLGNNSLHQPREKEETPGPYFLKARKNAQPKDVLIIMRAIKRNP